MLRLKKIIKSTKIFICIVILFIIVQGFVSCQPVEDPFTFIVAADMRYTAMEAYRNASYFQGACEAIKKVGPGSFMISPGDIDPPGAVRDVISLILGDDFPWYPVVGNHELEADSHMVYLRAYNRDGHALPHLINKGPPGCEETTYSFDWDDHHFVVLNQYYDGISDNSTDGKMVPELLDWLKDDLQRFRKKFTFVFGHEPLIAMPDMDNGRLRHQDDSLNKYPLSSFKFHQILINHQVTAYFCGHTHNTSVAKINGLWQIDVGHARGIEDVFPGMLVKEMSEAIKNDTLNGSDQHAAIEKYFTENSYRVKKILYYTGLTAGVSYKKISDQEALPLFKQFYHNFKQQEAFRTKCINTFWTNANLAQSTFIKVRTAENKVYLEIYRDDARGGPYTLKHRTMLDKI